MDFFLFPSVLFFLACWGCGGIFLGAIVGHRMFGSRDRNPLIGMFLGAAAGIYFWLPGVLIFAAIVASTKTASQSTAKRSVPRVLPEDPFEPGVYPKRESQNDYVEERLRELQSWHEQGLIAEEEYRETRQRILDEW